MHWLSSIVRLVARLFAFLAAKALLILAVLAISLSFSMASFVVPALSSAVGSAAAWVFGQTVVASVKETQRLRQRDQDFQKRNQDLSRRNRDLGERNGELITRNQDLQRTNSQLSTKIESLTSDNKQLRGRLSAHRKVTTEKALRIGQRAVRTSTRSIAAIPLESIPVLGVTTIIATTAWEIRDTCATLDDMAEIQRQLGQEPDWSLATRACEEVPLQGARVDHYGSMSVSECSANAEAARDRIFDLAEKMRNEVPDLLADENAFDTEIAQAANDEFEAINEICDCIADLACDPVDLVQR